MGPADRKVSQHTLFEASFQQMIENRAEVCEGMGHSVSEEGSLFGAPDENFGEWFQ